MSDNINLTPSEWDIMRIIWEREPCSLRSICDAASKSHSWTRHAVISFLKRMEQKGAISVEDAHPCKLYSSLLEQDETISRELSGTLSRVFDDDPVLMVSYLARSKQYSEEEIRQMIDILTGGEERRG